MATKIKTGRKPALGLLLPRHTAKIEVELTIKETEAPVIICRHVGDVRVVEVKPESFTIENTTDRITPYVVIIVPKMLVQLSTMPWRAALKLVRIAYQSGSLNEKISEFFAGLRS